MSTTLSSVSEIAGNGNKNSRIKSVISHVDLELDGDMQITLDDIDEGMLVCMTVKQDGVGGHAVTFGNTVEWQGGAPPAFTTTANAKDTFIFGIHNGKLHQHSFTPDVK